MTRGHRFGKRPGTVGIQRRKTRKASCRIEDLPALVVGAQRPTTSVHSVRLWSSAGLALVGVDGDDPIGWPAQRIAFCRNAYWPVADSVLVST